jgi:hypothetical protein
VVQATVRDATGAVIPNSVLAFSAANGNVKFSATSAMTATNGVATVTVTPVSAGLNAADQIIATGSVGTQSIRGVVAVQLIADQPRLAVSLSNSAVSRRPRYPRRFFKRMVRQLRVFWSILRRPTVW